MDTRVQPGDVILVHVEDKPAFFGRVEEILPDVKVGWRRIRFTVLTVPLQEMTWILEPSQIDGEPFTMGGTPIRIERLPEPAAFREEPPEPVSEERPDPTPAKPKVIAFPGPKKPPAG
ncbi:MAG: hypothetical protein GXP50_00310 [Deltaproteobacteria bacterium]|nr:hypothetical protein [Deltaproteobacteria bacterium]